MRAIRTYKFPNAELRIYSDRTVREFPRWCPTINVERSRSYAAAALRLLRQRRKS